MFSEEIEKTCSQEACRGKQESELHDISKMSWSERNLSKKVSSMRKERCHEAKEI